MKNRIISAIVALLICIPIIYYGGTLYLIAAGIIGVIGFNEMLKLNNNIPLIPKLIAVIMFAFIYLHNLVNIPTFTLLDDKLLLLLVVNLLPIIFYNKNNKYTIKDAFYLIGLELFLGIGFNLIAYTRNISLNLFITLLSITIFTDTFALVTGKMFGKHKLCKDVSPNKTIEGFIGGSIFGTAVSSILYINIVNSDTSIITVIILMLFLSVVGQLGDLVFSAIKRNYKIKDFGNIMPGHGGVLDRLDSLIFVVIVFNYLYRFI